MIGAQPKTHDFTPSTEIADQAFRNGDYKTALKHYEALGEDGDDRASMVTGLIYSDGAEGIEADKGKAAAWFKRSSDQGGGVGADLYGKMDDKNELNEEEKIEAKNLIHEFRESDSKLTRGQQTLISDSYSQGTYSPISGIVSQQHASQSGLVQISDANIYAVSTDIEASFFANTIKQQRLFLPAGKGLSEPFFTCTGMMKNHRISIQVLSQRK